MNKELIKQQINNYLNNQISIDKLILIMDKLNYTEAEIKEEGIVYTPKYICDFIIQEIKPKLNETILEPSVGHGMFIFSLLEYMQSKFSLSDKNLKDYLINQVYAFDLQNKNINEFKDLLVLFFKKRNITLNISELKNIKSRDTLREKIDVDIIIGNPPYIRIKNIPEDTIKFLRKDYVSCEKGNIDIYYAFIEYAYKNSNRSSFITPNSWLYNTGASNLRTMLKKHLNHIIDFKQKQIFESADTYTSIFFIDKSNESNQEIVKYSENIELEQFIEVEKTKLNDKRWSFNSSKIDIDIDNLNFNTPIATLRDKIFIEHGLKDNKDIIPFYKISKIKSEEEFFLQQKSIIFPYIYDDIKEKYIIKKNNDLNPETLKYLESNREELDKRDKGKVDKYDSWFAYGRKQGLNHYMDDSYLIIVPGMISNNYKFFPIKRSKLPSQFLFSSGFLLETCSKNVSILNNYLNSEGFKEYLKNNGKVWKGKNENNSYYSVSITQLKSLFQK